MTFFESQVWNFVSAILGLFSIAIAVYLFLLERKAKKWRQLVISANHIAEVSRTLELLENSFPGRIAIAGDQLSIDDLALVYLKIENTGNSPVKVEDFVGLMEISLGENSNIVDHRISTVEPEALQSSIDYSVSRSSLLFSPFLLNQREQFEIALLVSSMTRLYVNMRLVGMVQEIASERFHISKSFALRFMRDYILRGAIILILIGLWLLFNPLLGGTNLIFTELILPLLNNTNFYSGLLWGLAAALIIGLISRYYLYLQSHRIYQDKYLGDQMRYVISDR